MSLLFVSRTTTYINCRGYNSQPTPTQKPKVIARQIIRFHHNKTNLKALVLSKSAPKREKRVFRTSATSMQTITVKSVPTKPIEGQKTGTSGLRKKTSVFTRCLFIFSFHLNSN